MFYDHAKVYVKGGDGGNGIVAFLREKYVPAGGPAGGNGGRGGSVVLEVDAGLKTLADFKYHQHYRAGRGEHGGGKKKSGKNATDLVLKVPPGTQVKDAGSGEVLADLTEAGQRVVVARGGRGGLGNAHFATSINKAPSIAEKGEPGEERWLELELKLLADVGLVGFPNAGKSTLIASLSAARPAIADYPFTTLVPNLGVVELGEGESFVLADIPGLIEGAHAGAGLGIDFLRHLERTRLLVHVLDLASPEREPLESFHAINKELEKYSPALAARRQVVAANKLDLPGAEEKLPLLEAELAGKYEIFPISAVTGQGTRKLAYRLAEILEQEGEPLPPQQEVQPLKFPVESFSIEKEGGIFLVKGKEVERLVAMTYLNSEEMVGRLLRILRRMGVEDRLREMGARDGDQVRIQKLVFEYKEK